MSDFKKPYRSLVSLLPTNLKNSVNASILENVFDKSLTQEEAIKLYGLVGKYFPDKKDNRPWIEHHTLEREFNALTPTIVAQHGTDEYFFTFNDIVNKASVIGIDNYSMTEWLKSQSFNFVPPIDIDKFANFTSYYWTQQALNDADQIWNPDGIPEYYVIAKPKVDAVDKMPVSVATTSNIALNGTCIEKTDWTVTFSSHLDFVVAPVNSTIAPPMSGHLTNGICNFEYPGQLSFTVTAGDIPFAIGDKFTIQITQLINVYSVSFDGIGTGFITTVLGLQNFAIIDGTRLAVGMRVLVKNQNNILENGIYIVQRSNWVLAHDSTEENTINGIKVFVKNGTNKGTWQSLNNNWSKISDSCNLSNWESANYWIHVDDLYQYNLTANQCIQALRPIIEYKSTLERSDGIKTRFNQIPLFNLYWPDGTKTDWISSIFYYAEDPSAPLDLELQRRIKINENDDALFHQGTISPEGKILGFKDNGEIKTCFTPGPSIEETSVAIPIIDLNGNGGLTDIVITDLSFLPENVKMKQTWTLTAIEEAPNQLSTKTFQVTGSKSNTDSLAFPNAKVGHFYYAEEPVDVGSPSIAISFIIHENKFSYQVGDKFIFITGISSNEFSTNEVWDISAISETEFTVKGNRAGQLHNAIVNTTYYSDYISFDLDNSKIYKANELTSQVELTEVPFSIGQNFQFTVHSPEVPRYAKKDNATELPITFPGGIQADFNFGGCWLTPPQLIHNPELENRQELWHGDLTDNFISIIENQPSFFGNAAGSNNFRKINTKKLGYGGTIKTLMGNPALYFSLLNQKDLTPITLLDFAEQQYGVALNSLTDFLQTNLSSVLSQTSDISLSNIFSSYEDFYRVRSEQLNIFGSSTSPIINWPLTLPLIGYMDAVQPVNSKFDQDLNTYVRVHHDGHESPIAVFDYVLEYNMALEPLVRSDGAKTQGSVGTIFPTNPYKGQLFFNTTTNQSYFFSIDFDNVEMPEIANNGQLWFDRLNNKFYIWVDIKWELTTINIVDHWIPFNFADVTNTFITYVETLLYNSWLKNNSFLKATKLNIKKTSDELLSYELSKFAVANGVDPYGTNYSPSDPFTWNYSSVNWPFFYSQILVGSSRWETIYKAYFNEFVSSGIKLFRPDAQPWKLPPFNINQEEAPESFLSTWLNPYQLSNLDFSLTNIQVRVVSPDNIDLNNFPDKIGGIKTNLLTNRDKILLANQNNTIENGIYEFFNDQTYEFTSSGSFFVNITDGLYAGTFWKKEGTKFEQYRIWKPEIWDVIRAANPGIKLCVNIYTDQLLPPYESANTYRALNEVPTTPDALLSDSNYFSTLSNEWIVNYQSDNLPAIRVYTITNNNLATIRLLSEEFYTIQKIDSTTLKIIFTNNEQKTGFVQLFSSDALISFVPTGISDNYSFNDYGPIEQIWRKSIAYNYAQARVNFKLDPLYFLDNLWGFQTFTLDGLQINRITGQFNSSSTYTLHGEIKNTKLESQSILTCSDLANVPDMMLTAIYQQNDEKLIFESDIGPIFILGDNYLSFDGIQYQISIQPQPNSILISISDSGNFICLGDKFSIVDGQIAFIKNSNVIHIGLNQWYSEFLKFNSIDSNISENVTLLRNWNVKLGYRSGMMIETDGLKVSHDLYGALPDTCYDVKLKKSALFQDMWLHALRIEVIKISSNSKIIGQDDDANNIYIPINEGEDWEFRIESYFPRHPQITVCDLNTNGLYETFNALSKAHSRDEWVTYEEVSTIKKVNLPVIIKGIQNVVNFVHGYSKFLDIIGFEFGQGEYPSFDKQTQRIENWQLEIEKFIDNLYKGTKIGIGFSLNPFMEQFWVSTPQGLPSTFVKNKFDDILTAPFVYDLAGDIIIPQGYNIVRFDEHSEIYGKVPLFGAHVTIDAYEHIIILEKYISGRSGLLFDPYLSLMVEKLLIKGKAQTNYSLRPSFGGFVLRDQGFKKNLTASITDVGNYYNADKMYDREETSRHALALLGFSKKSYFDFLDVNEKTEFNFWRALIHAKGTNACFDAFLNSSKFEYAAIDEFWAYKIAEYGDAREKTYPEVKLNSTDCLLKHTKLYFSDLYTNNIPQTYVNIIPSDESRWYSLSDLNNNLYFSPEIIPVSVSKTITGPTYIELPIADKVELLTWTGPTAPVQSNDWAQNIMYLPNAGTYHINLNLYKPANPKFSPIKLIDYIDKAIVDDITVWNPAFDAHCSQAMEVVNIISTQDQAKYNYSTLTKNNESYDSSRAWGEREIGRTWLDMAEVDYMPYYDKNIFPSLEERLARWGSLAEYATLNLYEWIKSDVPPSEYDAKAKVEQLSADISAQDKKTGLAARNQTYQRTRTWEARPVAWSNVSNPSASQGGTDDVVQLTYASTRLFLSSLGVGPSQIVLEKGSFNLYGLTAGMRISAWFNNKPYGELELIGKPRYSIGSSLDNGGDLVVYPGTNVFNYIQVTWTDNKNYIGNTIGEVSIIAYQAGSRFYIKATEVSTGKSSTVDIESISNAVSDTFIEYDFGEICIKLRCNISVAGVLSEIDIMDEINLTYFDIEIRSYSDVNILIPFPTQTLDNEIPFNFSEAYSETLTLSGISNFDEILIEKGNNATIGEYYLAAGSLFNSSLYAPNQLLLIRNGNVVAQVEIQDFSGTTLTYNLNNILTITANSQSYSALTAEEIIDEITKVGNIITIGFDTNAGNIIFTSANALTNYGWRGYNIPTQDQLDNDLSNPYNSWSPIVGDYTVIPSTKALIDNIVSYNKAKLTLNDGTIIEKYKSDWNDWVLIEKEKYSIIGANNIVSISFSKTIDTSKLNIYKNGIKQLTSFYTVNDNVVTTNELIPVGHKIVAIVGAYEPTQDELKFNPDVLDDPKKQIQYKSDYQYAIKTKRDSEGNIIGNTYYFWVKGKTTIKKSKNLSIQQAEKLLIEGPSLFLTFQELTDKDDVNNLPVRYKGITIAGLSYEVVKDNTFKLRFCKDFTLRDDPNQIDLKNVHQEWVLMREKQKNKIPKQLWDKIVDTACGQNSIGDVLPSLARTLYDERHGTFTKYGFESDQILANTNLVKDSIKSVLQNPKSTLYRNGINTTLSFSGIQLTKLDDYFSSPEKIRKLMDYIWVTCYPQQINEIFFAVMNDALSNNYEFSDIFKTSRISAHSIITVHPEYKVNNSGVYY